MIAVDHVVDEIKEIVTRHLIALPIKKFSDSFEE